MTLGEELGIGVGVTLGVGVGVGVLLGEGDGYNDGEGEREGALDGEGESEGLGLILACELGLGDVPPTGTYVHNMYKSLKSIGPLS